MSRKCSVTNKTLHRGHIVSHANNKEAKTWTPNLHWKRVFDTTTKRWVRIKVTARGLRTINRKGLQAALRDAR